MGLLVNPELAFVAGDIAVAARGRGRPHSADWVCAWLTSVEEVWLSRALPLVRCLLRVPPDATRVSRRNTHQKADRLSRDLQSAE